MQVLRYIICRQIKFLVTLLYLPFKLFPELKISVDMISIRIPVLQMNLLILLWLQSVIVISAEDKPAIAKTGCKNFCGNITIPYPFGIGSACFHNSWYEINCSSSSNTSLPTPFLRSFNLELKQIDLVPTTGQPMLTVAMPFSLAEIWSGTNYSVLQGSSPNLTDTPYVFSMQRNFFMVRGCTGSAILMDKHDKILAGCSTICVNEGFVLSNSCYGVECCQTTFPSSLDFYKINFTLNPNGIFFASLVDTSAANKVLDYYSWTYFPTVLEWSAVDLQISQPGFDNAVCQRSSGNEGGYVCRCKSEFYQGNPYLPNGCKVVRGCEDCARNCILMQKNSYGCPPKKKPSILLLLLLGFGIAILLLLLLLGIFFMYKWMKKNKENKLKANFFATNGGLLLKQEMSSENGGIGRTQIFASEELQKATDEYNENRILGKGGQGTVYKGMLTDGRIVAIKKSQSAMDESRLNEFINELVILSRIDHRNIVNLLGCCLETEVPLLVYEFIPNGSLSDHLHSTNEDFFPMTWEVRFQIAQDVAGALAYMHSESSIGIYHRDIKSANILIDGSYRAKVSDFGISRSIAIDKSHLTTNVIGTFGYLDPGYYQSLQFTEKSDVYSFGVVVVELLTAQKAIRAVGSCGEDRTLSGLFLTSMENSCLFEIIDTRISKEGREDELVAVANLARRCLEKEGQYRPTMKEVAVELDSIRSTRVGYLSKGTHKPSSQPAVFRSVACSENNTSNWTETSNVSDSDYLLI